MNQFVSPQPLFQMIVGHMACQGIATAARLGIADLLVDGPRSVTDLAQEVKVHDESLYRLLRALASVDVFKEDGNKMFCLTPLAEYLRHDSTQSLKNMAMIAGGPLYNTWSELLYAVQTGEETFKKIYKKSLFDFLAENKKEGEIFDAAMEGMHINEVVPMLDSYDFSPFEKVIDVGGGNGSLLSAILEKYETINGMVFDLPETIERSKVSCEKVISRCKFHGGNFFESIPTGGDIYLMRHIIHDWNDDDSLTILKNCRKAMKPKSKVLIIENIIPKGNESYFGKWLDIGMLLIGGKERTEEEYNNLLSGAGLKLNRIIPTAIDISIIEGVL